ncbi:MAG: class IV adenylate cyclase, partial [Methanocorpusculum sp.]|nr:class IV adenylate cyclase [Methanocorpusculum sp.]
MGFEIEIKVKVDSLDKIRDNLLKNNCDLIADQDEYDIYFNAPHKDFAKSDEALRLRCVKNQKCGKIMQPNITYKGPKVGREGFKAREEIIADVSDSDEFTTILERIGFVKTAEVVKHREIYQCTDAIVTLDNLLGVGYFSEIEASFSLSEDEAVKTIDKTAEMAGISGERLTKS